MRALVCVLSAFVAVSPAFAQSAPSVSRAFEGTTVILKIDLPASSDGVDVKPQSDMPVDFPSVARNIKSNGIGVHRGESVTITKVVIKEHHIEFQLGGGGFGTFADIPGATPATTAAYEGRSPREKDLEEELKYTYDAADRKRIKWEIEAIQRGRTRDNVVASVVNAQTKATAESDERARRAQNGSRFNIRYDGGIPQDVLTPQGLRAALRMYVDFGDASTIAASVKESYSSGAMRKGLTVAQVEQLYGPAASVNQKTDGSKNVTMREYSTDNKQHVSAQFVGGVLVNYTITPP